MHKVSALQPLNSRQKYRYDAGARCTLQVMCSGKSQYVRFQRLGPKRLTRKRATCQLYNEYVITSKGHIKCKLILWLLLHPNNDPFPRVLHLLTAFPERQAVLRCSEIAVQT